MLAVSLAVFLPTAMLGAGLLSPAARYRGFADPLTPPPPPTFIPTPVSGPPGPPTPVPSVTPTVSATAAASSTPTATATARPSAVAFSLDAARVAKVGDRGDLQGLAAIKPGSKVWLMMYYTVSAATPGITRTTTYQIQSHGHTIFQVTYRLKESSPEMGRLSRYTVYAVPRTLPYGAYLYRAILKLGKQTRKRTWKFQVARQQRVAATSGDH